MENYGQSYGGLSTIYRLSILLAGFSCLANAEIDTDSTDRRTVKIAIVGGGVGGTATAYFLGELLDKKAPNLNYEIDIFEQSSKIGGRVATIRFEDTEFEAGGSILHERNRYAAMFLQKFGLSQKVRDKKDEKTCIYNGRNYVFCDDSWQFVTYLSLWYRYGFDPLRMERRVTKLLDQFERIYKHQENELAFEQVSDLLSAMGPSVLNLTKLSYEDLLENEFGFSRSFIDEIAQAVTLVNYGQTVSIPSFVGMVSFAGSGSELWSVSGGNKQLPIHLARFANAQIHLNTRVESVTYLGDHQFQVDTINLDQELDELKYQTNVYDYVIVATPMTSGSHIRFTNFTRREDLLSGIFDRYQMHQTVATFVKGTTLESYTDKSVLSCDVGKDGSFFTSFSPLTPVNGTTNGDKSTDEESKQESEKKSDSSNNHISGVFKLFSNSQLKTHDLYTFFDDIEEVREVIWHAYPEYSQVGQPFPPFKIRPGMYYLNAIEWAASAIEMSLIGGKNVALLVCHDLHLCKKTDDEEEAMKGLGKRQQADTSTPQPTKRHRSDEL